MRIVFYNSNNRNNIVFVTYHVGTRRVALLDLAFPFHKRGTPRFPRFTRLPVAFPYI